MICSGLAVLMGCASILGWLLELPLLASLGEGLIPMAPSTAILFLVYGFLLMAARPFGRNRSFRRFCVALFAMGAAVAALLFVLSVQGIFLDVEHMGMEIMGAVEGSPVGHMSPVTALTFIVFSILSLFLFTAGAEGTLQLKSVWWGAIIVVAVYCMLLVAYLLGTPMFYGGRFIPPAATTSLAFVAIGSAVASFSRPLAWGELTDYDHEGRHSFRILAALFVFLAAGIISAGYIYENYHEKQHLAEVERQLSAIADLKMRELILWREERLADGGIFHGNRSFASLVRGYLRNPDSVTARREVDTWLGHFRANRNYSRFFLMDARGEVRLSFPETAAEGGISSYVRQRGIESLGSGRITIADFYRSDHPGKIHLGILVPIFDPEDGAVPLAVLVMRIDPETFLYPFLQRWPNPSDSAEALLVRREGSDVIFLNELRFRKDTALKLRIPLERLEVPAVKAALGGDGIIQGIDYRGTRVVAALRAAPDSPWRLVSKMDETEILSPVRERQWTTLLLVLAMLLSAAAGVGIIWRQQRASHYRHVLEQTRRSEERLQRQVALTESINRIFRETMNCQTVEELGERCLAVAGELTGSSIGFIGEIGPDGFLHDLAISNPGWDACKKIDQGGHRRPPGNFIIHGIYGRVLTDGKGFFTNDPGGHPDSIGLPEGHPPLRSFLGVPLIRSGHTYGMVALGNREGGYGYHELDALETLAPVIVEVFLRKRAELAVAEREARLNRAEELAHLGHWRYEQDTGKISWSDEMYRIFGMRRKGGRNSLSLADVAKRCHPDDRQAFLRSFDPSAQEGGGVLEYRIIRPEGDERHLVSTGEVERRGDAVAALFGTVLDVTDLRHKERELQQKNAEMERFTYTVSHDLKSPLVTVRSFIGFLEKDMASADGGRIAKDLVFMKTATDRMSLLLDQVLVMSQVGKVVTPPVRVAFDDILKQVLQLVAGSILERKVSVSLEGDDSLVLYGDRSRLVEIWQNLIENAVKYMGDQAAPRIGIGVDVSSGNPVFFVSDNGMGIDPNYHDRIFRLFDKLDPHSAGTGLGLALVKRIVEMYEGKIWVESAGIGHGSCFRFTLPCATWGCIMEPMGESLDSATTDQRGNGAPGRSAGRGEQG